MPASPTATPDHIRDVNERYHDAAASSYDGKWGIDFGDVGRRQTRSKLQKALGGFPPKSLGRALEIGSGTGYFSLNLMQEGVVTELVATDVSGRMLASLSAKASELGLADRVDTCQADAEDLPFDDESFDLVVGHAVLHHVPDLATAFAEFNRVLRPGGAIVFCGEPSRHGDRLAAVPKRIGVAAAPAWRSLVGAEAAGSNGSRDCGAEDHDHALEGEVDVHAFDPAELSQWMEAAGFSDIRIRGEELLANAVGWVLRTLEASADPSTVPWGWQKFAFRSYLAFQKVDEALLEPRLAPQLFYNLVLSARKPA